MAKDFDAVEDAILHAYQNNNPSRRRVQIKLDRFKEFTLLEVMVGNVKKPEEVKTRVRLFQHGSEMTGSRETWGYNLTREQRCPMVAKMLFEGYTQKRISEMFRLSANTINNDVRYMRIHTVLLDGYVARVGHPKLKEVRTERRRESHAPIHAVH